MSISEFPHIQSKIRLLWGSKDLDSYLTGILINDDIHTRVGFDTETFSDLSVLARLHNDIYPNLLTKM